MSATNSGEKNGGEITVRRAESVGDYLACQEAQRRSWGISDNGYVIPVATMVGANLHGGLVIGAFLPSGEAAGMSFAFLGRIEGRLCLYSQLTGVVPAYQSQGLGYQIKLFQRKVARADGIERIAWAFDPLQAGNAYFNLTKLGARAVRYVENMYGQRTDRLNAGVPTDRLIAEWNTANSSPVEVSFGSVRDLPGLIEFHESPRQGPVPVGVRDFTAVNGRRLLLEIPLDITALRSADPALAEKWRSVLGQAFQLAFSKSYRAVHFVRDDSSTLRRGFYVLERMGDLD
jgi:predicted GNAT superfamily acetyltransferase